VAIRVAARPAERLVPGDALDFQASPGETAKMARSTIRISPDTMTTDAEITRLFELLATVAGA